MASNLATQRVISRLPAGIQRHEVADDIWVVPASAEAQLRTLLADQPHFLYFLDRGVGADEHELNADGDRFWTFKAADYASPAAPLIPQFAREVKGERPLPGNVRPRYITWAVKGGIVPASHLNCGTVSFTRTDNPDWALTYPIGGKAVLWQKMFGSVAVGKTVTMAIVENASNMSDLYEGQVDSNHLTPPYVANGTGLWTPRMRQVAVSGDNASLRKGWIMLTGPSGLDYGEVFQSFSFVLSRASTVAERMRAVIAFAKQKPNPPDCAKIEKSMADLEESGATILAFKGSPDVDPVHMWKEAAGSVTSLDGVEPDGETITTESKADGIAQWRGQRWCVTAVKDALLQDEILEALSGTGPLSVKRSGGYSVHVDDGEGILELSFTTARSVIRNALRAGRQVTFTASAFDDPKLHDQVEWDKLKSTHAGEQEDRSLVEAIPEAICTRLITPPMYDKKEELMLLPIVSPQSMWSDFARSATT